MIVRLARKSSLGLIVVMIVLTACTQAPIAIKPGSLPTPTISPASTTTPVPTLSPSLTTVPTATRVNTSPDLNEWDLLIISDSTNGKVGPYYAKLIETEQNVKVNLHDCWVSGLPASQILKNLQENTYSKPEVEGEKTCYQPWPDLVRDAEVMVLFGNPGDSLPPDGAWNVPESFAPACFVGVFEQKPSDLAAYKQKMLQSCAPGTFSTYQVQLNAILDEIAKIRNGKPLILRMTDFYIPVHANYEAAGVDDACTACMGNFSAAVQQVAKERGVPQFSTMNVLNGPEHLQDPRSKGYFGQDGGHLSDAGAQFVANALSQSGYAAWQPTNKSISPNLTPIRSLAIHEPQPDAPIAFSPQWDVFAILFGSNIEIYSLTTGELLKSIAYGNANCLAFSPNGKLLAAGGAGAYGRGIRVWDTISYQPFIEMDAGPYIWVISFSPDSQNIALGFGGGWGFASAFQIRELSSGKIVSSYGDPENANAFVGNHPTFNPDGTFLASSGVEVEDVHLWDLEKNQVRAVLPAGIRPDGFGFSPDGRILAVISSPCQRTVSSGEKSGCPLQLWDVATQELIVNIDRKSELPLSSFNTNQVVAFSPDGKIIANLGDGKLQFWDVAAHNLLMDLVVPGVRTFAFRPDGTQLATYSSNGVTLWGVHEE